MSLQKKSPLKSANAASRQQGKLAAIIGPTAAGKTGVALRVAEQYPVEIICADSRTIYRGMDIGTAKPTSAEQGLVPHHGLDLITPGEGYSAVDFVDYAEQKLVEIWSRGKAALLVGGSGMYIDALLFGYKFRNGHQAETNYTSLTHEELQALVAERYPEQLKHIDVKNTRRLQQLLERGPSNSTDRERLKYSVKILGIDPGREELQIRIEKRAVNMLNQGFVQECESLVDRFGEGCPALQTTGYAAVVSYLRGEIDYEGMQQRLISDTKKLAKKQRTWFQRNPSIHWVKTEEEAVSDAVSYLVA